MDYWSNPDSIVLSDRKRQRFPIEWVIVFIILSIIIIVLVVLLVKYQTERIDPTQCPKVEGSYGLIAATNGAVLNICGSTGNQPCQSIQPTLDAAVTECERQSNICSRFAYNGSNQVFSIIDPGNGLFVDQGTDVFTRQNNFIPNTT